MKPYIGDRNELINGRASGIAPDNSAVMAITRTYAAQNSVLVFRAIDGLNWVTTNFVLPSVAAGVAYDNDTNTVYVALASVTNNVLNYYSSTNFGETWTTHSATLGDNTPTTLSQFFYDPLRKRLLIGLSYSGFVSAAGTKLIQQSHDGGATWTTLLEAPEGEATSFVSGFGYVPNSPTPIFGKWEPNGNNNGKTEFFVSNGDDDTLRFVVGDSEKINPWVRDGHPIAYSKTQNSYVVLGGAASNQVGHIDATTFKFTLGSFSGLPATSAAASVSWNEKEDIFFVTTRSTALSTSQNDYRTYKSRFGFGQYVYDPAPVYNTSRQFGMFSFYDSVRELTQIYTHGYAVADRVGVGYLGGAGLLPTPTPTITPSPSITPSVTGTITPTPTKTPGPTPTPSPVPNFENLLMVFGDNTTQGRVYSVNMDDTFTETSASLSGVSVAGAAGSKHIFTKDRKNLFTKYGGRDTNAASVRYSPSGATWNGVQSDPRTGGGGYAYDFTPNGLYMVMASAAGSSSSAAINVYTNDGSNNFSALASSISTPSSYNSICTTKNGLVIGYKNVFFGTERPYLNAFSIDGAGKMVHLAGTDAGITTNSQYFRMVTSDDAKLILMTFSSNSRLPYVGGFDGTAFVTHDVTFPFVDDQYNTNIPYAFADGSGFMLAYRQQNNTEIPQSGILVYKLDVNGKYVFDYAIDLGLTFGQFNAYDMKAIEDTESYVFILGGTLGLRAVKLNPTTQKYEALPASAFNVLLPVNHGYTQIAVTEDEVIPVPSMSPTPTVTPTVTPSITPSNTPSPSAVNTLKILTTGILLPQESTSQYWRGVAYSESLDRYVAVAFSGTATDSLGAYSDDGGLNWQPANLRGPNNSLSWAAAAWSEELQLFVAIPAGTTGVIAWSSDGITWNYSTTTLTGVMTGIIWVKEHGKFYASYQRSVATSVDGKTWVAGATLPSGSGNATGLAYWPEIDTVFVGGNAGHIWSSTNAGSTWTQRTNLGKPVQAVAYWPERSSLVAFSGDETGGMIYSNSNASGWSVIGTTPLVNTVAGLCYAPGWGKLIINQVSPNKFVDYTGIPANTGFSFPLSYNSNGRSAWSTLRDRIVNVGANSFAILTKDTVPTPSNTPTPTPTPTPTTSPIDKAGLVWVDRGNPMSSGSLTDVVHAPSLNLYVATGSDGRIFTSPDAINWTYAATPAAYSWQAITWSPEKGLFVIVAADFQNNNIATSPDGVNWTLRNAPSQIRLYDVLWAKGLNMFVVSANSNIIYTSPDGITWTSRTVAASAWESLAYSPSLNMVIALANVAGTTKLVTSTDGITWTPNASLNGISWSGASWSEELGVFSATGGYGVDIATSSDGVNWTIRSTGLTSGVGTFAGNVWADNLGMFVYVGSNTNRRVRTSIDGSTLYSWPSAIADSKLLRSVIFNSERNLLVAVGASGVITGTSTLVPPPTPTPTPTPTSSPTPTPQPSSTPTNNGNLEWVKRTLPDAANPSWSGSAWSAALNRFVAVNGTGTTRVATSQDGKTWVPVTTTIPNGAWRRVIWVAELNLFVAIGISGTNQVMTSPDGINWTGRTAAGVNQWMEVTWSPTLNLLVAVAFDGTGRAMTSPDGINWTLRTMPGSAAWYGVTWSPKLGIFVAVASNGSAATSTDGISWVNRSTSAVDLYSVSWSPELEMFAAVGGQGDNRIQTSVDGIVWNTRVLPVNSFWTNITWAKELGLFVAVAATGSWRTMTSPNGIHWTALSDTVTNPMALNHVSYSSTMRMLLTVGASGACATAESTTIPRPTPTPTPSPSAAVVEPFTILQNGSNRLLPAESDAQRWAGIAYSNTLNRYVAVASAGTTTDSKVAYSDNGVDWTAVNITIPNYPAKNLNDIAWSEELGTFVAITGSPNGIRALSPDGINWTYHVDTFTTTLSRIIWVPELHRFFATYTRGIVTSVDGKTWTAAPAIPGDQGYPLNVCYVPKWNTLYTTFSNGVVYGSTGGTTAFTQKTVLGNGVLDAMLWDSTAERFIVFAQGANGGYNYTTDGLGWTSKTPTTPMTSYTYAATHIPGTTRNVVANSQAAYAMVDVLDFAAMTYKAYAGVLSPISRSAPYSPTLKTIVATGNAGRYMVLKYNL